MTPAEFSAALTAIRRPAAQVAELCGYARQAGSQWATGARSIPPQVVLWVRDEAERMTNNPPPRRELF